jgi:ribosomal protein L17
MLTSLIIHGKVITTSKRAYMLKAFANSFFADLVHMYQNNDEVYARRETVRRTKSFVFGNDA